MRTQGGESGGVPRAPRAVGRLHHSQSVGSRHREGAGGARVRGARHHRSLGLANMLGRADSHVTRAEVIANCRVIAKATDLPVNADLENCFAHEPEAAAETIRLAAEAGTVGASIEDYSGDRKHPIYDFDHAVARVRAAVKVAHALPVPVLLTARAENLLHVDNDSGAMADTIRRLQAYEAAGADVLYAPGLRSLEEVRDVVRAVSRPLNVVTGWLDPDITLAQLSAAGAKRISVGGALSRLVLATFVEAARAMREHGSFAWMRDMIGIPEVRKLLAWAVEAAVDSGGNAGRRPFNLSHAVLSTRGPACRLHGRCLPRPSGGRHGEDSAGQASRDKGHAPSANRVGGPSSGPGKAEAPAP